MMNKTLIILSLLMFSANALLYNYTTIEAYATVCNNTPSLNITSFSATSPAYSDSPVTFWVTTKNPGNCYTMDYVNLSINVYNSFGVNVYNGSQSSYGGHPAGSGTGWTFGGDAYAIFPAGAYTVNLTAVYTVVNLSGTQHIFNSSTNSSLNLTVATRPATGQGPGGGGPGGGGAVSGAISQPSFVQFNKYPVLQEVAPGSFIIVDIGIKNPLGKAQNISVNFTGIPTSWLNLFQSRIRIDPYQTKSLSFTIDVPDNAEGGDYLARATVYDGGVSGYSYFVIRIKKYPDNYPAPQIYRRVDLNFIDNKSQVQITVQNDAASHERVDIYEKIPKLLADNVREVDFNTPPSSIVEADPLVMFTLEDVRPQERRVIDYVINNVIDQYEPYVYWQIEQINVLYDKDVKVQLSNIYQTIIERGGAENYLIFDIGNVYTSPLNVTIRPWLPTDWNSTPASIFLTIPPRAQTTVRIKINVPADIQEGVYYGGLYITYENISITKELVFRVQELSILGWFFGLFSSGLLILVIIAILFVIAVRMLRKERGYAYKEDVSSTLSQIKNMLSRRR